MWLEQNIEATQKFAGRDCHLINNDDLGKSTRTKHVYQDKKNVNYMVTVCTASLMTNHEKTFLGEGKFKHPEKCYISFCHHVYTYFCLLLPSSDIFALFALAYFVHQAGSKHLFITLSRLPHCFRHF
jgi:hypothetical protein